MEFLYHKWESLAKRVRATMEECDADRKHVQAARGQEEFAAFSELSEREKVEHYFTSQVSPARNSLDRSPAPFF
jgi:hypothetical protein